MLQLGVSLLKQLNKQVQQMVSTWLFFPHTHTHIKYCTHLNEFGHFTDHLTRLTNVVLLCTVGPVCFVLEGARAPFKSIYSMVTGNL